MFTNPTNNLKALGLKEDSIVADLGAGTGFYSVAAGLLTPKGKVYAVEIVKDFLATIKNKAREAHLNNIEILWGDIEKIGGTKIRDGVVDAVIASNVFFQLKNKDGFVEEIKRILKAKGRVFLIDWSPDSGAVKFKTALPKDQAREIFEKKGFVLDRNVDVGDHHYGMILIKP